MPLLKLQTNVLLDSEQAKHLILKASRAMSDWLGKPESYVMVIYEPVENMCFAGSTESCVFAELKSIGLPLERTPDLSAKLCDFLETEINVSKQRVFIEFANAERPMWGWNGRTF